MRKKLLWIKPLSSYDALFKMADLEVLRELIERKYTVYLIGVISKNQIPSRPSQLHIIDMPSMKRLPLVLPLIRAFFLLLYLPIYLVRIRPDYIVEEPDVSILSFIPLLLLRKIKKFKLILDIRSTPVETTGFLGFLITFWFSASLMIGKKYFDGITIITNLMKEEICTRFKINYGKIGVWTSGVSTALFDPSKYINDQSKFRNELGLSSRFVVFYHGAFSPTRGLLQVIEAINILKRTHSDITLFLLGNGQLGSKLKCLVRESKLENNIVIHDAVNQLEVPRFINMSDIAIVPLPNHKFWRNQSPLKILEYLSMNKVIILTDIPAHRSIIDKNKCGLYLTSIKPVEIAKVIEYCYDNKKRLNEWGKTGREIVKKNYTWKKVTMDLDKYLSSI